MADSPPSGRKGGICVMRSSRSTHTTGRIAATLLGGASLLAITPAAAQDTQAAAATQPTPDHNGQNVILVTALKREQNLQDVPMAITALGNETLSNLQVNEL